MLARKRLRRYDNGGASSIPWVQLAQLTSKAGSSISGDKSDIDKNYLGNLVDTDTASKIIQSKSIGEGLDNAFFGGLFGTTARREKNDYNTAQDKIRRQNFRGELDRSQANLINYDALGSNLNNIYAKYGGSTLLPIGRDYAYGGNVTSLSDDNGMVNGRSHAQGGVKFPDLGVELEGQETINNSNGDNYVFSKELGFADIHKKLARQIGKVEKRPYNSISATTMTKLRGKEEELKQDQELLKTLLAKRGLLK